MRLGVCGEVTVSPACACVAAATRPDLGAILGARGRVVQLEHAAPRAPVEDIHGQQESRPALALVPVIARPRPALGPGAQRAPPPDLYLTRDATVEGNTQ